jgi:tRNA-dihydrouridine synthase B
LSPPSQGEIARLLIEHVEHLHEFYGEPAGVRIARKHIGWYAKGQPEDFKFREIVNRAESAREQLCRVREYFALAA